MTNFNNNKLKAKQDGFFIGRDKNNIYYYIKRPSFECGWVWCFGYVEGYSNNREWESQQHFNTLLNTYDKFTSLIVDTPLSESDMWLLLELFSLTKGATNMTTIQLTKKSTYLELLTYMFDNDELNTQYLDSDEQIEILTKYSELDDIKLVELNLNNLIDAIYERDESPNSIYGYENALKYLNDNDPSLVYSLEIASNKCYEAIDLDSCKLANLLIEEPEDKELHNNLDTIIDKINEILEN